MTHPDSELLALGRQFENAKAQARKLDPERVRLYAVYALLVEGKSIAESRKIARECGYSAASDAFTAMHSEAIRIMRTIYRAKATTLEGFAVKLAAVTFDQFDFELYPDGGDVAEVQLLRLCRQIEQATAAARRVS